jgi:hypothetical protein
LGASFFKKGLGEAHGLRLADEELKGAQTMVHVGLSFKCTHHTHDTP